MKGTTVTIVEFPALVSTSDVMTGFPRLLLMVCVETKVSLPVLVTYMVELLGTSVVNDVVLEKVSIGCVPLLAVTVTMNTLFGGGA